MNHDIILIWIVILFLIKKTLYKRKKVQIILDPYALYVGYKVDGNLFTLCVLYHEA